MWSVVTPSPFVKRRRENSPAPNQKTQARTVGGLLPSSQVWDASPTVQKAATGSVQPVPPAQSGEKKEVGCETDPCVIDLTTDTSLSETEQRAILIYRSLKKHRLDSLAACRPSHYSSPSATDVFGTLRQIAEHPVEATSVEHSRAASLFELHLTTSFTATAFSILFRALFPKVRPSWEACSAESQQAAAWLVKVVLASSNRSNHWERAKALVDLVTSVHVGDLRTSASSKMEIRPRCFLDDFTSYVWNLFFNSPSESATRESLLPVLLVCQSLIGMCGDHVIRGIEERMLETISSHSPLEVLLIDEAVQGGKHLRSSQS
jgi:hypothetical protein